MDVEERERRSREGGSAAWKGELEVRILDCPGSRSDDMWYFFVIWTVDALLASLRIHSPSIHLKVILQELVLELEVCFPPIHPARAVSSTLKKMTRKTSYHVLS